MATSTISNNRNSSSMFWHGIQIGFEASYQTLQDQEEERIRKGKKSPNDQRAFVDGLIKVRCTVTRMIDFLKLLSPSSDTSYTLCIMNVTDINPQYSLNYDHETSWVDFINQIPEKDNILCQVYLSQKSNNDVLITAII